MVGLTYGYKAIGVKVCFKCKMECNLQLSCNSTCNKLSNNTTSLSTGITDLHINYTIVLCSLAFGVVFQEVIVGNDEALYSWLLTTLLTFWEMELLVLFYITSKLPSNSVVYISSISRRWGRIDYHRIIVNIHGVRAFTSP